MQLLSTHYQHHLKTTSTVTILMNTAPVMLVLALGKFA
jgi:hypothetical protein